MYEAGCRVEGTGGIADFRAALRAMPPWGLRDKDSLRWHADPEVIRFLNVATNLREARKVMLTSIYGIKVLLKGSLHGTGIVLLTDPANVKGETFIVPGVAVVIRARRTSVN